MDKYELLPSKKLIFEKGKYKSNEDFKDICKEEDKKHLKPIYENENNKLIIYKILKKHVLPTIVQLDALNRIKEYDQAIGLPYKF